jgi:hypothetical protein
MTEMDDVSLRSNASGEVVQLPENWATQLGWLFDVANYETYSKVVRLIQMWQGVRSSTEVEATPEPTGESGICWNCGNDGIEFPYREGQRPRRVKMIKDGQFDDLKQEMRDHLASLPQASSEASTQEDSS